MMNAWRWRILLCCMVYAALISLETSNSATAAEFEYDIVVYGGTSGGIMAAVQAKRMGKSVVVLNPDQRIGGLTTGGLGQTDIGNKAAIGGLSLEFYRRVAEYYGNPEHWTWQQSHEYRARGGRERRDEAAMWTFEPSAALKLMQSFVAEAEVPVVAAARLDRTPSQTGGPDVKGVIKTDGRIVSIKLENGDVYRGKMFIDATYEGDLLAGAGVSYTVGREGNAKYNEQLNGVQTAYAKYHIFAPGVDPYLTPGDRASGLLPGIDPHGPGEEGAGDHRVQAYCYRMCLTDHPENRIPFEKPADYDPLRYELLLRNYEAGETGLPWINAGMPNRKTDTNNRLGFSTDFIGANYDYPEASYADREEIARQHLAYQKGLMWTLAYHPRMPEAIRREISRWGLTRDEFQENGGWPEQLYIREARRMVGEYVMTEHNCTGAVLAEQPVGLAAYTMDSHHVQRYVNAQGNVQNEGDVEVGGFSPYPIDFRAILPQRAECENLLVPVCVSSSHMAFGSIRMEPVFMVLGQSAATAAALAIDENLPVQQVPYDALASRLLKDGQILEWNAAPGIHPKSLSGIVVDDEQAVFEGDWARAAFTSPFIDRGYHHDRNENKGSCRATFKTQLPAGTYEVRLAYSPLGNRAPKIPVAVRHAGGTQRLHFNGKSPLSPGEIDVSLGQFTFRETAEVTISNEGTNGFVAVDGVRFVPVSPSAAP